MTKLEAYLEESHYRIHELHKIQELLGVGLLPRYRVLQHNKILYDLWSAFGEASNTRPRHWENINEETVTLFKNWLESEA